MVATTVRHERINPRARAQGPELLSRRARGCVFAWASDMPHDQDFWFSEIVLAFLTVSFGCPGQLLASVALGH